MTKSCGSCSLCCKLLGITELAKPPGKWCPHAKPGKGGCSIYADRPHTCRTFTCGWLVHPQADDHWHPLKCKMVISYNYDNPADHVLQFWVDPSARNRWQTEPYHSKILMLAREGREGSKGQFYRTEIRLSEPTAVIGV